MKVYSAKVGTIPALIVIRGRLPTKVPSRITFRHAEAGAKWQIGIVDKVNADGYMFIELM